VLIIKRLKNKEGRKEGRKQSRKENLLQTVVKRINVFQPPLY
jgi:hypothetical protein